MIGLIVLIVVSVMISGEAKKRDISSIPYIFFAIVLALSPSLLINALGTRSMSTALLSSVLSIGLMFIPYVMIKNKDYKKKEEDSDQVV